MTEPLSGEIWRYDYLWRWQHDGGETEGRKRRPTAFVSVVKRAEGTFSLHFADHIASATSGSAGY